MKQFCGVVMLIVTVFVQVTKYVEREILNHKQLIHPHIIRFNEVCSLGDRAASYSAL